MRRCGFLFEAITDLRNLLEAAQQAARGKKSRPEVARFLFHLETELLNLQEELRGGCWQPSPYRTFSIVDPKPRLISAAPFHDRVVHHAIMKVLDPWFERSFIAHTYACRKGKGTHAAIRFAQRQARRFPFFLKGDIEACFESMDHSVLKSLLRRSFKDPQLLSLLDRIIDAGPNADGRGLPIGNLTSQYFANHLLGQLDLFVKQVLQVRGYLRYMDDFLLFAGSKPELHQYRGAIRAYLAKSLRLELKERASWIAPTRDGVPFLGFRVFPGMIRLEGGRWRRLRKKIRFRERRFVAGEISAEELATSIRSSIAHLEHAATLRLRREFFTDSESLG